MLWFLHIFTKRQRRQTDSQHTMPSLQLWLSSHFQARRYKGINPILQSFPNSIHTLRSKGYTWFILCSSREFKVITNPILQSTSFPPKVAGNMWHEKYSLSGVTNSSIILCWSQLPAIDDQRLCSLQTYQFLVLSSCCPMHPWGTMQERLALTHWVGHHPRKYPRN